jgi:hypothetical protein
MKTAKDLALDIQVLLNSDMYCIDFTKQVSILIEEVLQDENS